MDRTRIKYFFSNAEYMLNKYVFGHALPEWNLNNFIKGYYPHNTRHSLKYNTAAGGNAMIHSLSRMYNFVEVLKSFFPSNITQLSCNVIMLILNQLIYYLYDASSRNPLGIMLCDIIYEICSTTRLILDVNRNSTALHQHDPPNKPNIENYWCNLQTFINHYFCIKLTHRLRYFVALMTNFLVILKR